MTESLRVTSAEPVIHGVLKLSWSDGTEGLVDFRHLMAIGKAFLPLRDPAFFRDVRVAAYGHGIEWINEDGREIDFESEALHLLSKSQADILLKASRAA